MKKTSFTFIVIFLFFAGAFSINQAIAQTEGSARKIGWWDSFWAKWDGIDPEVYVMMKNMDKLMTEMLQTASIAKEGKKEGEFKKWLKEKLTDKVIDWVTHINPAVNPIKKMYDYAMKGTKSWLDWSFRKTIDTVYKKYKKELERARDMREALKNVDRWLKDWKPTLLTYQKQKDTILENKDILFSYIVKTHQEFHPETYKGIPPLTSKSRTASLRTLADALRTHKYKFGWSGGEANDYDDSKATYFDVTSVVIEGDTIKMRYNWKDGILTGKISGNLIEGTYWQTNGSGEFYLKFNSDYSYATGWWRDYRMSPNAKHAAFMKRSQL